MYHPQPRSVDARRYVRALSDIVVPQLKDDSSDGIYHGFLLRNNHIAIINHPHSVDPEVYVVADQIQSQMSPVWARRYKYVPKQYVNPGLNGSVDIAQPWVEHYDRVLLNARNDPLIALALEANPDLRAWQDENASISWIHKRYRRSYARKYNSKDGWGTTEGDSNEVLRKYIAETTDEWVNTASEKALRSRMRLLMKVAHEGRSCKIVLDHEDESEDEEEDEGNTEKDNPQVEMSSDFS
jgi:hypothetical protein